MSQHDMDVSNQTFTATRADINAALQALASNSSGATEPATTFAYQWWADTTSGFLKQRNAANSGWVNVLNMATGVPTGAAASGANSDITALLNASGIRLATRTDVASASTVVLTSAPDDIQITGTTAITGFTVPVGRVLRVRFAASLTLTNNANIVTQTGANIVTQAGDTCILRATAANVVEVVAYVPAVLNQQATRSTVRVNTGNGYGSTNTAIPRFTNVVTNQGADITYADSATAGASFTINTAGVFAISFTAAMVNSAAFSGVSLNSSQLATSISTITAADRLCDCNSATTSSRQHCGNTVYLPAGSVVRPHTDGTALFGAETQFTITRVF
jgi:hypothetical protein